MNEHDEDHPEDEFPTEKLSRITDDDGNSAEMPPSPELPAQPDKSVDPDEQFTLAPPIDLSLDEPLPAPFKSDPIVIDLPEKALPEPPPETINQWIEETVEPTPPNPDDPTLTITLDDLFDDEASDAPSDPPGHDSLPPRPVMTALELDRALPLSDDDETPSVPMEPIRPPRPVATDQGYGSKPKEPDSTQDETSRPRMNLTPPRSQTDEQATVVNPRRAFYSEEETARAREVEEIRRKRRSQLRDPDSPVVVPPDGQETRVSTRALVSKQASIEAAEVAQPAADVQPARTPRRDQPPSAPERVVIPARETSGKRKRSPLGCVAKLFVGTFLLLVFGLVAAVIGLTLGYVAIANDLPPVSEIETRTSKFETVFIYDADGNELYRVADPTTGNRTYVSFNQIDQDVINATIATEDSRFYENVGFDPIAIGRAMSEVILSGAITRGDITAAGGASTITQQLVRATLLDADERGQQTIRRKIREIILSAELNRTLTRQLGDVEGRNKILELYLNEIYYGNRSYGIEAAAQTYFKKSAADLTLAEASLLAGLPQAPALWDPVTAPEYAEGRQLEVLTLLANDERYNYNEQDAQDALNQRIAYSVELPSVNIRYPHFTLGVLAELESKFGGAEIYNSGLKVYTTIRPQVQQLAEEVMAEQRGNVESWSANNAAMVVMEPGSAEILALVGSLDYRDEAISGQVNMARAARQPGSTIKPFVYLAGMERGYTPATLFWDVPSGFPDGTNPAYTPKNYDNEFHGPMLLRTALGNSYNIPAVKALEHVGVCNFVARSQAWGLDLQDDGCLEVNSPRDYGLALSLGGGTISPLRMASAYAMLANGGQKVTPVSIRSIINKDGEQVFSGNPAEDSESVEFGSGVSADLAFLITNILTDNNARSPEFEQNNLLNIPNYTVGAKTGTSGTDAFDVRDAWTIGFTPNLVAAVWVGNTDNQPMAEGASGYRIAAPIWNSFMTRYLAGKDDVVFIPPNTVTTYEVCSDSGTQPTPTCGDRKTEYFSKGTVPLSAENHFVSSVSVDRWTLRIANEFCGDEEQIRIEQFDLLVSANAADIQARYRQEALNWLGGNGNWWATRLGINTGAGGQALLTNEACAPGTERPIAVIQQPFSGESVQGLVQIGGQATAPGFAGYELSYGYGDNPSTWIAISDFQSARQPGGLLGILDTNTMDGGGLVTVRLVVYGPDNPYTADFVDRVRKEARIQVTVPQPVNEPTITPAPTATNTPQATAVPPTEVVPTVAAPTAVPPTQIPATAIPVPTEAPVTDEPTLVPTIEPTIEPTSEPVPTEAVVTVEPTVEPTPEPSPTSDLVVPATRVPDPTPEPTTEPTTEP